MLKNEVAKLALGRLGVSLTVADLDTENTVQAKVIRNHLRTSLDTILEAHDWGFASSSIALPLIEEFLVLTDGNGWRYSYSLPADCMVLREISRDGIFSRTNQYEDEKERWEAFYSLSGPRIYSDVPDAYGRYTVKLADTVDVPTHFGRAWAAQLSMDIAPPLITNNYSKVSQMLNSTARNNISLAIATDLGRQPQRQDSLSPFLRVRG